MRAEASMAMDRASMMATCALTAAATSRDSRAGRQPKAPTGRNPSIRAIALNPPGMASVGLGPWVMARRLA